MLIWLTTLAAALLSENLAESREEAQEIVSNIELEYEIITAHEAVEALATYTFDTVLVSYHESEEEAWKEHFGDIEYAIGLPDDTPVLFLGSIELPRNMRGKGIGSKIMRQLEQEAKDAGAPLIALYATETDRGSPEPFYKSLGFRTVMDRPYGAAMVKSIRLEQATFTGWTCVQGPCELVDWLVDRGHEVQYSTFEKRVDLSTAPLDEAQIELLPNDWSVTWLKTELPSGKPVWVMQHSGIEHLFAIGDVDLHAEKDAAVSMAHYLADNSEKALWQLSEAELESVRQEVSL